MKIARFMVDSNLLGEVLAFPKDVQITSVMNHPEREGVFVFFVSGEIFKEVEIGGVIPIVTPLFTVDYNNKPAKWLSVSWEWRD